MDEISDKLTKKILNDLDGEKIILNGENLGNISFLDDGGIRVIANSNTNTEEETIKKITDWFGEKLKECVEETDDSVASTKGFADPNTKYISIQKIKNDLTGNETIVLHPPLMIFQALKSMGINLNGQNIEILNKEKIEYHEDYAPCEFDSSDKTNKDIKRKADKPRKEGYMVYSMPSDIEPQNDFWEGSISTFIYLFMKINELWQEKKTEFDIETISAIVSILFKKLGLFKKTVSMDFIKQTENGLQDSAGFVDINELYAKNKEGFLEEIYTVFKAHEDEVKNIVKKIPFVKIRERKPKVPIVHAYFPNRPSENQVQSLFSKKEFEDFDCMNVVSLNRKRKDKEEKKIKLSDSKKWNIMTKAILCQMESCVSQTSLEIAKSLQEKFLKNKEIPTEENQKLMYLLGEYIKADKKKLFIRQTNDIIQSALIYIDSNYNKGDTSIINYQARVMDEMISLGFCDLTNLSTAKKILLKIGIEDNIAEFIRQKMLEYSIFEIQSEFIDKDCIVNLMLELDKTQPIEFTYHKAYKDFAKFIRQDSFKCGQQLGFALTTLELTLLSYGLMTRCENANDEITHFIDDLIKKLFQTKSPNFYNNFCLSSSNCELIKKEGTGKNITEIVLNSLHIINSGYEDSNSFRDKGYGL